MTGHEVASLRRGLGLDPMQFALMLGIHPSSVYRWESAGNREVRVDPLQSNVLLLLQQELAKRKGKAQKELGEQILQALVVGSGLFALFKLLEAVFGKK